MWKVFDFVGREQGEKIEIKLNSGYYLMQQERSESQLLLQQTLSTLKTKSLHNFSEDQKHWDEILSYSFPRGKISV